MQLHWKKQWCRVLKRSWLACKIACLCVQAAAAYAAADVQDLIQILDESGQAADMTFWKMQIKEQKMKWA